MMMKKFFESSLVFAIMKNVSSTNMYQMTWETN